MGNTKSKHEELIKDGHYLEKLTIVKKYKDPKYGVICLLRDKRDRIFLMKQKEYSKRDFHY